MATNAAAGAPRQLASAAKATAYTKKYTVPSTGVWERIRRAFAVDPNRSSGVPLNPQYRNPPPGANPPEAYDDPVTIPAGDIAENPYYRRDIRRSYPRLSVVNQADVVGLLSLGSAAKPREDVLQIGDAGAKQLVQVKQEGEEKGLAALFEKDKKSVTSIFGPGGLPPFPSGASRLSPEGGRKYVMDEDGYEGYPDGYPWTIVESHDVMAPHVVGGLPAISFAPSIALAPPTPAPPVLQKMAVQGTSSATPQDIVFSCCICFDTLAEVYKREDRRIGLHHEPNQRYGRITRLYLTGCAHVVCAEHLEGGGAPFHSSRELPKTVCPFCKSTKGDNTLQVLFGINGTGANDHDANIPQTYFDTPPAGLVVDGENMDALRFQYVSILRYATMTHSKRLLAEHGLAKEKAAREQECAREEEDRKKWAERTRKMQLLGKILTATQSQLKRARDWLVNLGQDVSSIDDSMSYQHILDDPLLYDGPQFQNYQDVDAFDEVSIISGDNVDARLEQERTAASTQRIQGQLQLARGSAADLQTMTRHGRNEALSAVPQGQQQPLQTAHTHDSATSYQQPLNTIHTHAPAVLYQQPSNTLHTHASPSSMQSLNRPLTHNQDHHSTLKRKRTDGIDEDQSQHVAARPRIASRDAMPPPLLPAQRFTPVSLDFGPPTAFRSGPSLFNNPASRGRNSTQSPATLIGHASPFEFRGRDDGELDNTAFHQPTPQRQIYRPNSVSPVRERLTLMPRMGAPSRGTATGLLSHARSSSSAANVHTPSRTASHRQQLGQSPYFGIRQIPTRLPGRGMDPMIVNGLSFMEEPVVGSGVGRKRARR